MRIPSAIVLALALGTCLPAAQAQEDDACLTCHADPGMLEGVEASLVDPERLAASIHGQAGLACVDCHQDLAGFEDFPHAERLEPVDCGVCHEDAQLAYATSFHAYAALRGNRRAPDCVSCHGSHDILPGDDPASRTHHEAVNTSCAACHGATGLRTDRIVKLPRALTGFAESVHGSSRTGMAANCADCHGVHDVRTAGDPESRIHRGNVATTCGACHGDEQQDYTASIHGRAAAAGIEDSPTCTDCHGEHLILSPADPAARTHAVNIAVQTCGACHDDPMIVARYGLRGGVVGSYVDSYHGWATRGDDQRAATCVSCHGAHLVLPAETEESTIHPDNVVATCARCHKKADARFAASYTHEAASITANPINRWIRTIYRVLIALIVGGMVLHNVIVLNYYAVEKRRWIERTTAVQRLDLTQRLQHGLLAGSFIVLVITGFALRFPDAWWVRYLSAAGMGEVVRGTVHRVAGVVLIVVGVAHAIYVVFNARGRRELSAMAPRPSDLGEFADTMRYYTWRSPDKARFGRYDYTQKLEYWALIWGTALMVVTGFVLWFPAAAVQILPTWIVPASQTVHYYEAWLATLAILFWHFFFVIFHPEEYPMNWAWLTGKISARFVRGHHPRWHEELVARKKLSADDDEKV